jgi:hypothetical protein
MTYRHKMAININQPVNQSSISYHPEKNIVKFNPPTHKKTRKIIISFHFLSYPRRNSASPIWDGFSTQTESWDVYYLSTIHRSYGK